MASIFSGSGGRKASIATGMLLQESEGKAIGALDESKGRVQKALTGNYKNANKDLDTGYDASKGFLTSGYQQGQSHLDSGYTTARGDVTGARDSSLGALDSAYGDTQNYLEAIQGMYEPYAANGRNASDMLSNATGLGGAEGNAAARAAFQTGPQYEWNVEQSTDAAARKMAALGLAGSGNTVDGITRLAHNLANGEWNSWLDALTGQVNTGMQATAGQAAGKTAQATAAQTYGQNKASVYSHAGDVLSGLATGYGKDSATLAVDQGRSFSDLTTNYSQNKATLDTRMGDALAGFYEGQGQNKAAILTDFGKAKAGVLNEGMKAGEEAAGRRFGAIMGGVDLAAKAVGAAFGAPVAGGGSVGGNMFSKLFG